MAIPKTLKKLDGAQHALAQMETAARHGQANDFEHSLSSFLNSSRNVTFALEKEAKQKKDAWFPAWRAGLPDEDRELLARMNKQRIADVHRGSAVTASSVQYVPTIMFPPTTQPWLHTGTAGPPGTESWVGKPVHYFVDSTSPEEVLPVCRGYLKLLERLVQEFFVKYPEEAA